MSSEIGADIANVNGALRFKRLGSPTPVDIPANGVLEISVSGSASITIGGGGATSLVGIKYVDEEGNQIVLNDDSSDVKFFRAAPGVTITVMHNQTVDLDAQALPAAQRILTSSSKNFTLELINTQAFFAYSVAASGFRWGFADRQNYTPGNSADWDGDPATQQEFNDRVAAALAGLLGAPIP